MLPNHHDTSVAYSRVISDLMRDARPCSPRGDLCYELDDYGFTVSSPTSAPIVTEDPERNATIAKYTRAEFRLFASGERRAAEFAKAAPFWSRVANPDGTVNSNYGWLVHENRSCGKSRHAKHEPITPWDWARLSLLSDKETRQAVLRVSLPSHQWFGNKDQVCTMHGYFRIREGALSLTVVMRSNDVVKGLVYDMPWFCGLLERMREELLPRYPDLKLGTYTHFAHSMHLYGRDVVLAHKMIGITL